MGYMGYDRQRLNALRAQMDVANRDLSGLRCADAAAADATRAITSAIDSLSRWIPIVDEILTQDPLGRYHPVEGLPGWYRATDPLDPINDGHGHGERDSGPAAPVFSTFNVEGKFEGKLFRKVEIPIQKRPGAGETDVDLFIGASQAGIIGMHDEGNNRGFILDPRPEQSKMQVHLNFETGIATMIVAPSCDKNEKGCVDARQIQVVPVGGKMDHSKNNIQITEDADEVRLQVRGHNARRAVTGPTHAPSIDDVYLITPNLSGGTPRVSERGDRFPSETIQQSDGKGGDPQLVSTFEEVVDVFGVPELTDDGWDDLVNDPKYDLHP